MPVLGDFGLAFRTRPTDPNNPQWYNARTGTPGFYAPEQIQWYDARTKEAVNQWPLNEKTNVYGLGMILWCLVRLRQAAQQPFWLGVGENDTTLRPLPIPAPWNYPLINYSQPLKDLIDDCLAFSQAARPSFQVILNRIQAETDERPGMPDRALGMRSGEAELETKIGEHMEYSSDDYQLGMARHLLP